MKRFILPMQGNYPYFYHSSYMVELAGSFLVANQVRGFIKLQGGPTVDMKW